MNQNPLPTFYEFFAGGGMARLGLGDGWQCEFANDFDAAKAETYRTNFPDSDRHFHEGDVWKIKPETLKTKVDLAWASSPCQDFSLAGSRAGLVGGRSSAFFGFWKIIEALGKEGRAPRTIVIENVVGLLSSHKGEDFTSLCEALSRENYVFGALEIDAIRFVPQSRPRVFIIATQNEIPAALTQIENTLPFHSRRVVTAFSGLPDSLKEKWVWWHVGFPPTYNKSVAEILDAAESAKWLPEEKKDALLTRLHPRHKEKLNRAKQRENLTIGTLFRRMRVENGEKIQRAEIRFDGFAGCLRTPGGGSSKQFVVAVQGNEVKIRTLTGREGARLMGIPESYIIPDSENRALSLIGDGVAVPVVSFIRNEILDKLTAQPKN